ncbi:hypothetical protein [Streptomyces mirabilis]|uniref:hypothetical protein n=1 Tax=Streptomyces mirabilis TaxID=68239 RepID=UPI0036A4696D
MPLPQSATPRTSRPAAALTVLGWTLLSAFALRGLMPAFPRCLPRPGRRPARSAGRSAARPATEDFSDLDEEADSIRQFQQR